MSDLLSRLRSAFSLLNTWGKTLAVFWLVSLVMSLAHVEFFESAVSVFFLFFTLRARSFRRAES